MKCRFLILAMMTFGLGVTSCGDDYDDTWVRETTADLEARVAALEEWQKNVNAQISSLQSIVAILEKKDYVTKVIPLVNGTGYVISFQNSGDVTILNGEKGEKGDQGEKGANGEKGDSPVIGVKQDTDGKYYWTLNGEWLMDGDKIMPVTGEKGDKGEKGDQGEKGDEGEKGDTGDKGDQGEKGDEGDKGDTGEKGDDAIAPQVRINKETNVWEISTDGGNTWTSTDVKATGEKGDTGDNGDSMFSDIDVSNSDYVVLTLADGTTTITLPRYQGSFLRFHYEKGFDWYSVDRDYTNYLRFYYPDNLTKDKFDAVTYTVMPVAGANSTRSDDSGWSIREIDAPKFKDDGTLDTNQEYEVCVCYNNFSYSAAVVTIYLNYKNGKQETTSAICYHEAEPS